MNQSEKIRNLKEDFTQELSMINDLKELDTLRTNYLGKKGPVQELSKLMSSLALEEKKDFGMLLNDLKGFITKELDSLKEKLELEEIKKRLSNESVDVTLPSTKVILGTVHPLERIIEEIEDFFVSMGYDIACGPEVEKDLYNFEMLNLPKGHPARDAQDSFYITEEMLLRTHTSPVQVRVMLANEEKGPIRILCPGKTYRRDNDDATHSHQFMQVEGLIIDKNISLADLKGTWDLLAKKLFGSSTETRFRPSFYPFTEPSVELDVSCFNCDKGCNICKGTGWITIAGAGVVHPNVLKMSGYDPEIYTGFAFGMGAERIAMLKYGINDIRAFYTNDLRTIKQFDKKGGE